MSTNLQTQAQPKSSTFADVLRIILAIILPPVGVLLQVGLGMHFWLNIVLTLCGYIPGLVHAVWVIAKK
ncbi:Proteolipid membrane potential modulator [Gimesia alba]|uniref:Proteolipid membrane potential modulator n=1 Tax=Gimesia alba TaxID=2527973 RepID=A0A517RCR7_9PLAN|nr:Proteolipid membrane potential modulator [Gimesia alba]